MAFSPRFGGARPGGLTVRSNVPGSQPVLALSGDGMAPELTVRPAALDLGHQPVGTSGAGARIEMTNTGPAPLEITATTIRGPDASDFRIVGGSCRPAPNQPVVVRSEQSCDLWVQLRPRAWARAQPR